MKISGLLLEDWPRKLVALFFAVIIWYYVDRKLQEVEPFENIPVKIEAEAPLTVLDGNDHVISLDIRGPKDKLDRLTNEQIEVKVEVPANATVGSNYLLLISEENIKLPRGLTIEDINPTRIAINLDKFATKSVPVRISTTGSPKQEYDELEEERRAIPPEVDISGPAKLLEGIEEVLTETEYFDNQIYQSYQKTLRIQAPFEKVTVSNPVVTAYFEIEAIVSQREFEGLPIKVMSTNGAPWKLSGKLPVVERISINGPKNVLEKFSKEKVHPMVDLSGIKKEGKTNLPVKVWIDHPGMELLYVSPSSIEVFVEKDIEL